MRLIDLLLEGQEIFEAAHDLSQGGLASTLCEMVLRNDIGVIIETAGDPAAALFSETPGRVLVAIEPGNASVLDSLAKKFDIEISKIGVTGGDSISFNETQISLEE